MRNAQLWDRTLESLDFITPEAAAFFWELRTIKECASCQTPFERQRTRWTITGRALIAQCHECGAQTAHEAG